MKRKIIYLLFGLVCIILIVLNYNYSKPKIINKEFEGVVYRLGEINSRVINSVKIKFNGSYTKYLFKEDIFKGKMYIDSFRIYNNIQDYDLVIKFDNFSRGTIGKNYNDQVIGENTMLGFMCINSRFDKFTITIDEPEGQGSFGWSSTNGLMISAPCVSREEALNISKEVMEDMSLSNFLK